MLLRVLKSEIYKKVMKTLLCFCIILLFSAQSFAYEMNVWAESAHVAGGAVLAGAATAVADKYWPENRFLIGFFFSTAIGIIDEEMDRVISEEKYAHCIEDIAFHTVGAAIGTLITDKFILMPVMKRDHTGSAYYGIAFQYQF